MYMYSVRCTCTCVTCVHIVIVQVLTCIYMYSTCIVHVLGIQLAYGIIVDSSVCGMHILYVLVDILYTHPWQIFTCMANLYIHGKSLHPWQTLHAWQIFTCMANLYIHGKSLHAWQIFACMNMLHEHKVTKCCSDVIP